MHNLGRGMWRRVGDFERLRVPQLEQQLKLQQYLAFIEFQKEKKRQDYIRFYRNSILQTKMDSEKTEKEKEKEKELVPELEPKLETVLVTELEPKLETELVPELEPKLETELVTELEPELVTELDLKPEPIEVNSKIDSVVSLEKTAIEDPYVKIIPKKKRNKHK
jgi:hypothetical protein